MAGLRAPELSEEFPGREDAEEGEHAPKDGDALLVHAREGDVWAVGVVWTTRTEDDDP